MEKNQKTDAHLTNIQSLAKKIKGIRIAMLTTLTNDGVLHSRPMGTQEAEFDGTLWFFTKIESGKVHQIEHDQHVNVAYADNDGHSWISVAGRASMVQDRAKMKELWTPILKTWFPEGVDDPQLALLQIEVDSAQIWDAPGGKLLILKDFVKATMTGQAMPKNDHSKKIDLRH